MAVDTPKKVPFGVLRGLHVLVGYLLGIVLIFVGERLIGGQSSTRWILGGTGAVAMLVACMLFLIAWKRSDGERSRIEGLAALLSLGGLLALVLYLLGSDLVMGPAPVTRAKDAGVGLRQVLLVAWPILMVLSVLPLIFVQVSTASMGLGRGVEGSRVRASALSGAMTASLLCTLFLINAIAARKDVHRDLSYFKTTTPSDVTREMITGLDADTQAILFFPEYNDVLQEVCPYFDELKGLSERFTVSEVDRALEPDIAKEYRAARDGSVMLVRGKSRQKIDVGTSLDRAKRKLRKLDSEVQKALLKLTRKRQTVYTIIGHGERGADRVGGDDRSKLSELRKILRLNNLMVKNLGPVEGLASEVPADAAMLLWTDPSRPLFPGEASSLRAYLNKGGRMLITLDPESPAAPVGLLEFLGLSYSTDKLAHDHKYIPLSRSPADRYNLVTNAFSSHAATSVISRYSRHLPVLFPRSGSLDKAGKTNKKATFIVKSLDMTWPDKNADMTRSEGEKGGVFNLAAAVSMKIKMPEKPEDKKEEVKKENKDEKKDRPLSKKRSGAAKTAEGDQPEMRVVVFADTDVFADDYLGLLQVGPQGYPPNRILLTDVLKWLLEERQIGGVSTSEEDVKIAHTRAEDVTWFYVTVFAVPLFILGVGAGTRWGRGRKRRTGR
jgi:hypothetical protein